MDAAWRALLREADDALGIDSTDAGPIDAVGDGWLRSVYPVSDLATGSLAAVASALRELLRALGFGRAGGDGTVVDRALCDAWFGGQVAPVGWTPPSPWDPLSQSFRAADSWIRLHANAPHHRAALLAVLGCDADAESAAAAVAGWAAVELETAVIERGGAAAALRSEAEWAAHPAGAAVAAEPLIGLSAGAHWDGRTRWQPTPERPLAGLRVLDLTRVIAGPTATQVLAGLGAEVLRIDPLDWDEPVVLPLVMWDKRTARVDGKTPGGVEVLRGLLEHADVLVHGYRAGALDRLGLGEAARGRLRPGLIDVSERAYGFTGPWEGRRGFDSLVQFATGIADEGRRAAGSDAPVSLPVQALDFATGYLVAAAAVTGVVRRLRHGTGSAWSLSLARTAHALQALPRVAAAGAGPATPVVTREEIETPAGRVALAASPIRSGRARLVHTRLAVPLGADSPAWAGVAHA